MANDRIECQFMGKIGSMTARPGVLWIQFYDLNFDTEGVTNLLKLHYQHNHGKILIAIERQEQHDSTN